MAVGDVGIWTDSAGGQSPGTSFTTVDFATETLNQNSIYSESAGVVTLTEAGLYLVVATCEYTGASNRMNPNGQIIHTGSGDFISIPGSGYTRDANNDETSFKAYGLVSTAATTDTVACQHRRDGDSSGTGTAANVSTLTVIRLHDSASIGMYEDTTDTTDPSAATWADVSLNSNILENDTDSIQRSGNDITIKNTARYLIGYGFGCDNTSGVRTSRLVRMESGGSALDASTHASYSRDSDNQYMRPSGMILYDNSGSTVITMQGSRQGATETGTTSRVAGVGGVFVVELPSSAEVYIGVDGTAAQDTASTSAVTHNAMRSNTAIDTDSFASSGTDALTNDSGAAIDALVWGNIWATRTSSNGTRLTRRAQLELNGTDRTRGRHISYNRGTQGSDDCPDYSFCALDVIDGWPDGQDVQLETVDNGYNDGNATPTIANQVGFFAINLGTLDSGPGSASGNGALSAQAATVSGEGTSSSAGNGAADSGAATISGSGDLSAFERPVGVLTRFGLAGFLRPEGDFANKGAGAADHTGNGALQAGDVTIVGEGTYSSTGNGALTGQDATVSGEGTSSSVGNGALVAQDATVSGSGVAKHLGEGALSAQNAAVSGEGTSQSVGNGALAAQDASVTGEGTTASVGNGALTAQDATVSGEGTSQSVGNGALSAQDATVSGEGYLLWTGNGALAAQDATVSGEGTSQSVGNGALSAQDATIVGEGELVISGNGSLAAQDATVSGHGTSSSVGNGALSAQDSTIAGSGAVATAGNGALNAGDATITGEGTSQSVGNGALDAQDATIAGSGTSSVSGNGALAANDATIAGSGTSQSVGNGALAASAATVSGEGYLLWQGNGALAANDATISGEGTSSSTGNGALTAQDATVSGEGTSFSVGNGALDAGDATISGSGVITDADVLGGGTLVAGDADIVGEGISFSIGNGALAAGDATISGSGLREGDDAGVTTKFVYRRRSRVRAKKRVAA